MYGYFQRFMVRSNEKVVDAVIKDEKLFAHLKGAAEVILAELATETMRGFVTRDANDLIHDTYIAFRKKARAGELSGMSDDDICQYMINHMGKRAKAPAEKKRPMGTQYLVGSLDSLDQTIGNDDGKDKGTLGDMIADETAMVETRVLDKICPEDDESIFASQESWKYIETHTDDIGDVNDLLSTIDNAMRLLREEVARNGEPSPEFIAELAAITKAKAHLDGKELSRGTCKALKIIAKNSSPNADGDELADERKSEEDTTQRRKGKIPSGRKIIR